MGSRSWKRTRRRLRRIRRDMDERKRREMRVPWWIRFLSVFIDPRFRNSWVCRWQQEHEAKLRRAMKVTARVMRRIEK